MNRLKVLFTSMALTIALVAAYSFTHTSAQPAIKSSAVFEDEVWIKYDCNNEGVPVEIPGGQNYSDGTTAPNSGIFEPCDGENNTCAIRYLRDETHPTTGNNRLPNEGAEPQGVIYCVQ